MLPATGYFKNIKCPFYNSSICERPYCHYKHIKQDTHQDAKVISQLVSTVVHKVLHFTSNTNISLNYVKESSVEKKITYNPTPIATLNKYKNNSYLTSEQQEEQPVNTLEIQYPFEFDVRNYVNPSVGYNPTPKPKSVQYIPSKKYISGETPNEPVIINSTNLTANYNSTNNKDLINNSNNNITNYKDDFNDTFSCYSNIKPSQSSPISSIDGGKSTKSLVDNTGKLSGKNCAKCRLSKSISKHHQSSSKKSSSHENNGSKSDKSKSTSNSDKYSSSRHKHHDTKRTSTVNGKSNSKNNSHSSKDKSKHKSSKETKLNPDPKSNCNILSFNTNISETPNLSSKNEKLSSNYLKNSIEKSFNKVTDSVNKSNADTYLPCDNIKSEKPNLKNKKNKHQDHFKQKFKEEIIKLNLLSSTEDDSSCDSQESRKSKHQKNSQSNEIEYKTILNPEPAFDLDISYSLSEDDDDSSDGEINNNTLEQCRQIFDEYEATLLKANQQKVTEVPVIEKSVSNKRVAHKDSSNTIAVKISKPNPVKNAATVMADRYKSIVAKLKEKHKHVTSRKAVCLSQYETNTPVYSKLIAQNESLIKPPIPMEQEEIAGPKIRIAPVQNVQSLLNKHKRIAESYKKVPVTKTPITTLTKGSERVAHAPDQQLANMPTLLQSEKSKLPVNVRNRYYTLIVHECMKMYNVKDLAYKRALYEELGCYLKCTTLPTYRNCCMLSINRLRKESEGNPTVRVPNKNVSIEFLGLKFYENIHKWVLNEQELLENGYPRPGAPKSYAIFKSVKSIERIPEGRQLCVRCKKTYPVNKIGFAMYPEDCIYHPGRRYVFRGEAKYNCCRETTSTTGCCICSTHVFETQDAAKLTGFVSTFEPDDPNDPKSLTVYALDCEMVYTTRGVELARVTIVDHESKVVYENMVRPLGHILDCNTRFSGLTSEMLENISIKITDVQAGLLLLLNSKTILIGHSVESDLKALRLIHNTVIDTSVLFPHKMGLPHKRSLKGLASECLQKIIQNNESGHDSAEDATTALELVIWKLKQDH